MGNDPQIMFTCHTTSFPFLKVTAILHGKPFIPSKLVPNPPPDIPCTSTVGLTLTAKKKMYDILILHKLIHTFPCSNSTSRGKHAHTASFFCYVQYDGYKIHTVLFKQREKYHMIVSQTRLKLLLTTKGIIHYLTLFHSKFLVPCSIDSPLNMNQNDKSTIKHSITKSSLLYVTVILRSLALLITLPWVQYFPFQSFSLSTYVKN